MFSALADAVLQTLNDNKQPLGITTVEYAERGKEQTLIGPAVLLWLEPGNASAADSGMPYQIACGIHLFCLSAPEATQAAALDAAFTLSKKVLDLLVGTTLADCYLEAADSPIEIVETGSNAAIVAVNLTTQIRL